MTGYKHSQGKFHRLSETLPHPMCGVACRFVLLLSRLLLSYSLYRALCSKLHHSWTGSNGRLLCFLSGRKLQNLHARSFLCPIYHTLHYDYLDREAVKPCQDLFILRCASVCFPKLHCQTLNPPTSHLSFPTTSFFTFLSHSLCSLPYPANTSTLPSQ